MSEDFSPTEPTEPTESAEAPQPQPAEEPTTKPLINFDDFMKLDLRVGTIVEASDHPNADKLICLKVDLGDHQRQIIAGLKAHYEAADLLGKQIVVVANLQPRKMRGLESAGMLLAASSEDSEQRSVVILTPASPVANGASVS